jgi:flagellar biosynthesis/type III secretory pathway chaperone
MIKLTEEESRLFKEGKLRIEDIEQYRLEHAPSVDAETSSTVHDELSDVKKELKELAIEYRSAIQRNKDLYEEIIKSRQTKAELRNKIADTRKRKKELLGALT